MSRSAIARLTELMAQLRDPKTGCPWDRKQTLHSLTPHTLEEVHEVIQAIELNDDHAIKDELGDLLFQIVFYAQIASEDKRFNFDDIVEHLITKMKRRHPHVFARQKLLDDAQLNTQWDKIKAEENNQNPGISNRALDNLPVSLPALAHSQKLQKLAAKNGFDWPHLEQVIAKLNEELTELNQAILSKDMQSMTHEMGDLLLSCVNLSRRLNIDAEQALRLANQRFKQRFECIEDRLNESGTKMSEATVKELESLWQAAKKLD